MSTQSQTITALHVPQIKIEQVTPQMAAQYLGTSAGNRNLKRASVAKYARDMTRGQWVLNGESIKFDRAGHLIDGHHRLSAVGESKATVTLLVIRGIQEGAMLTLDTGVGRSFADSMVVGGQGPVPAPLAPALRWWFKYELAAVTASMNISHQELQVALDAHPHVIESARFINRHKIITSRCVPGVQAFVHAYASWKFDREMADQFIKELNDGTQLAETSPIYLLRRRLVDQPSRTRLDPVLVLALTIKAWNAWIAGRKLQSLRWQTQGDAPEPFPAFTGDEERFERARQRTLQKRTERLLAATTPATRAKGGVASMALQKRRKEGRAS